MKNYIEQLIIQKNLRAIYPSFDLKNTGLNGQSQSTFLLTLDCTYSKYAMSTKAKFTWITKYYYASKKLYVEFKTGFPYSGINSWLNELSDLFYFVGINSK